MRYGLICLTAVMLFAGVVAAEEETKATDTAAIEAAVANYLEGWFSSDPARMERAFHPNLAKYNVSTVGKTDSEYVATMSAEELVAMASDDAVNLETWSRLIAPHIVAIRGLLGGSGR